MCILSATVDSVAATKLFTCPLQDGKRQFVVYSNTVDTPIENNTMVLPVPNPDSVEFFNMSHYKTFWDNLKSSFRSRQDEPHMRSLLYASRSASPSESLPVFAVGSYAVSIVPTTDDFTRLNPHEFTIDSALPSLLALKYSGEFGYLVCKLRKGNHGYHPFAYMHDIHPNRLLFLPTYHLHPDGSYLHAEEKGDWDHVIYSVGTDLHQVNILIDTSSSDYYFSGWDINWEKLPSEIRWAKKCYGQRIAVTGRKVNKDIWLRKVEEFPGAHHRRLDIHPDDYNTYTFPFTPNGLKNLRKAFDSGL